MQTSDVMALEPYVSVDEDAESSGARVVLTRVNLQVVNGLNETASINGYGNVIIGYDEVNTWDFNRCSDGQYANQVDCESAGEIWDITHKTGSHNLVLGSENSYSQYGGLVAGYRNFINRSYATISGGALNTAMGEFSSIMGGVRQFRIRVIQLCEWGNRQLSLRRIQQRIRGASKWRLR